MSTVELGKLYHVDVDSRLGWSIAETFPTLEAAVAAFNAMPKQNGQRLRVRGPSQGREMALVYAESNDSYTFQYPSGRPIVSQF